MILEGKQLIYFLLNDCGIAGVDPFNVLLLSSLEQSYFAAFLDLLEQFVEESAEMYFRNQHLTDQLLLLSLKTLNSHHLRLLCLQPYVMTCIFDVLVMDLALPNSKFLHRTLHLQVLTYSLRRATQHH